MDKLRLVYEQTCRAIWMSHLDTMRTLQRAVKRAGIPIRYSEGFSPHQIMSFASPLGVGLTSDGEYLDIEVNSMTTTEEMKDALNRTMVEGVEVVCVGVLPDTVKNAMASVAGGVTYCGLLLAGIDAILSVIVAFVTVCAIRFLAVRYHISLPVLRPQE